MTFERGLYDDAYYASLHPHHWFKNPPRKYEERNRDVLRLVAPGADDIVVELGSARGDIPFLLAQHCRRVIGVDAAAEAIAMAEAERRSRDVPNVQWLQADVADLSALETGSADAVAAIDLEEHIDDPTLQAMLTDCRRILKPEGRLGIYTPDRLHYVERLKANGLVLKQFPQHIAMRPVADYLRLLRAGGFEIDLVDYSVSAFLGIRWVERLMAPLPLVGPLFRYRILLRGRPSGDAVPGSP